MPKTNSDLQRSFSGISSRLRWHLNHRIRLFLPILNRCAARLTIIDGFGSPGDTLLTAVFAHNLHGKWPRLRLQVISPNPDLIEQDPCFSAINRKETYWSVLFSYLDLLLTKSPCEQVLKTPCARVGLSSWNYRAKVFLQPEERRWARQELAGFRRPIVSINAASRERVKTWPVGAWNRLVQLLAPISTVVQLGDSREPELPVTCSFAGKLTRREAMAILGEVDCHIGPDSFLMHAANGVDTPAVILFGASRLPANMGYDDNENLSVDVPCKSCWIHDSHGQECTNGIRCMSMIEPEAVLEAAHRQLAKGRLVRG